MKIATQLFGHKMIMSNASGCSSVWGGTSQSSPWAMDEKGRGPNWSRSLFEDNAEYGYGQYAAREARRQKLYNDAQDASHIPDIPDQFK
jgi:pyruvate/2-oxoacid:ferredoxin oxidoreductase beta subunit